MNDFENESFAFMRMTWENSDAAESRIQDSLGFHYMGQLEVCVKLHPISMWSH